MDKEGNDDLLMEKIINHQVDGTNTKHQYDFFTELSETNQRLGTTKVLEIMCHWNDDCTTYSVLKDIN